jgi:hypothetical protein
MAPLVIQMSGALSVMVPARAPAELVMTMLAVSVFTSSAPLALSVNVSDVPALTH